MHSEQWSVIDERFRSDIIQAFYTILINNSHFEVSKIDNQTLLNFQNTLLQDVVGLGLSDFCNKNPIRTLPQI